MAEMGFRADDEIREQRLHLAARAESARSACAHILAEMPETAMISFARGAPSPDIMPVDEVRKAAETALTEDWQRALSYGSGRGHPGLAEWIAGLHGVSPEQVMVTNGSMEAANMVIDRFVEQGDRVVVEQPTYDRTLALFERAGADLIGAQLESDGIDIGAVERACEEGPVKLVHVIPNFHNPAGSSLSVEKRKRLVELAQEHDFVIFEDDPYRLVFFEEPASETMLDMDDSGHVLHASSFSKTVSPGVRVGYLVGPEETISDLAEYANSIYISPNMLAESVVWELCRSGKLEENIEKVNTALRERRDALVSSLHELIPEARFDPPAGGYFLWLDLDDDVDTEALLGGAEAEGATFVAGPDFMISGGKSSLRLSFASVPADQIPEGIARIARALEQQRAGSPA